MEAGARGIPLDKVVYYVNFQSMHKDQPATQMFHESEAAKKLGGHYWWSQGGDSVLETYCAKRSECRQAGDRRVQLVHICLFDDRAPAPAPTDTQRHAVWVVYGRGQVDTAVEIQLSGARERYTLVATGSRGIFGHGTD